MTETCRPIELPACPGRRFAEHDPAGKGSVGLRGALSVSQL